MKSAPKGKTIICIAGTVVVKWTDAWSLAAGSLREEPLLEKQIVGCSQTHGTSPSLRVQKSHAGVYSKEVSHNKQQSGRFEDVCCCSESWNHPKYWAMGTDLS